MDMTIPWFVEVCPALLLILNPGPRIAFWLATCPIHGHHKRIIVTKLSQLTGCEFLSIVLQWVLHKPP